MSQQFILSAITNKNAKARKKLGDVCELCGSTENANYCHIIHKPKHNNISRVISGLCLCSPTNKAPGCHYWFDYFVKPRIKEYILNGYTIIEAVHKSIITPHKKRNLISERFDAYYKILVEKGIIKSQKDFGKML